MGHYSLATFLTAATRQATVINDSDGTVPGQGVGDGQ